MAKQKQRTEQNQVHGSEEEEEVVDLTREKLAVMEAMMEAMGRPAVAAPATTGAPEAAAAGGTAQTLRQMTSTLRGLTSTVAGLNRTIVEATAKVRQEVPPGMLHLMQAEIASLAETVRDLREDEKEEEKGVSEQCMPDQYWWLVNGVRN